MPGYGNWQELYKAEYFQLEQEGYELDHMTEPSSVKERLPIFGGEAEASNEEERHWRQAYERLWQVRSKGIRAGFPFTEPESLPDILTAAGPVPLLKPLSQDTYRDRIKGAWFGRCAGVVLGKPLEMGWDRIRIKEYLESVHAYPLQTWVPSECKETGVKTRRDCLPSTQGNVRFVQPDDDIHYTVSALLMAEEKGLDFTTFDVGMNMLEHIPYHWFWTADRQTYYELVNLSTERDVSEQVAEIPLRLNPWRECMVGFLRADFWGYISPADPRAGATYMYRVASLNLVKNGVYGALFAQGCISAALSQSPSVEKIIEGGLSLVPRHSRLAHAIRDVCAWYESDRDFTVTCDRIYEKYGHWYFAATINNLAFVTLALLHGALDFGKTITAAVMCGTDTDCNAGTAGSIVAAALGYDALPSEWITPLNNTVKTVVAGYGQGTVTDLAERTIRFYEAQKAGA